MQHAIRVAFVTRKRFLSYYILRDETRGGALRVETQNGCERRRDE